MNFESWRGTVGLILPTMRPGALEELIRLLPEGVGVIPLFLDVRHGTQEEFEGAVGAIEAKVKELAQAGVDLVHQIGAPPMMVQGLKRETELVKDWEAKYGKPILTTPVTQTEAMHALGMQRIVGLTYIPGPINDVFAQYFRDAGFDVLALEGLDVPFHRAGQLSSHEVYSAAKALFLRHQRADGIYLLGAGWRTLDIVAPLEQDLGVPVVHAQPARVWAIQRRLHIRQPLSGYGRLLETLPPPAASP